MLLLVNWKKEIDAPYKIIRDLSQGLDERNM
jgi:hypothetical protein